MKKVLGKETLQVATGLATDVAEREPGEVTLPTRSDVSASPSDCDLAITHITREGQMPGEAEARRGNER